MVLTAAMLAYEVNAGPCDEATLSVLKGSSGDIRLVKAVERRGGALRRCECNEGRLLLFEGGRVKKRIAACARRA